MEVTLAPGDSDDGRQAEETVARLVNIRRSAASGAAMAGRRGLAAGAEGGRALLPDPAPGADGPGVCLGEGSYRSRDAIGCRTRLLFDNGQVLV